MQLISSASSIEIAAFLIKIFNFPANQTSFLGLNWRLSEQSNNSIWASFVYGEYEGKVSSSQMAWNES